MFKTYFMFYRHFKNLRPKKQKRQKLTLSWITFLLPALRTAESLQGLAFPQACFQAMGVLNSVLNACCVLITSVALYLG